MKLKTLKRDKYVFPALGFRENRTKNQLFSAWIRSVSILFYSYIGTTNTCLTDILLGPKKKKKSSNKYTIKSSI